MTGSNLRTPRQIAELRPAYSYSQLKNLLSRRAVNGLAAAVVKRGGRLFIDLERYDIWLLGQEPEPPKEPESKRLIAIRDKALELAAEECMARGARLPRPPRETPATLVADWIARAAL